MVRETLTLETTYTVVQHSTLSDHDRDILVHLYQPIIGFVSLSLFLTLWSECDTIHHSDTRVPLTHQRLTSLTQMTLKEIENGSRRLEAVGLMTTFLNKSSKEVQYAYVLMSPLTPSAFLKHEVLSSLLIDRIGKEDFERTRLYYVLPTVILPSQKNVSAKFEEVFGSPHEPTPSERKLMQQSLPLQEVKRGEPTFSFDFETFTMLLKDEHIPLFIFSPEIKEKLAHLAALYSLSLNDMRTVVTASRDMSGNIQMDLLSKNAARLGKKKVTPTVAPLPLPKVPENPKDLPPVDYLREKNFGHIPVESEISLVTMIQQKYQLTNEVMNAIIEHTLDRLNHILNKSYVEKLASTVVRAQITTWEGAMTFLNNPNTKGKTPVVKKAVEKESSTNKEVVEMDEAEVDAYIEKWLVKSK